MSPKWRTVLTLAMAEFLGMALWFSASAVTPALRSAWQLNDGQTAWLTMSVQIGFVVGALTSAFLNLADIYPPRYVFAGGALLGALANGLIPLLADSLGPALLLRFITGIALAAVYPVGMKILATWMKEDRGLGLGLLIGALTLGSASPHLIRALGGISSWQSVLYVASLLSVLSAILGYTTGHLGPFQARTPPFNWRYSLDALRDRGVRLANFGYLGHMWELYAVWTWIPLFLLESFQQSGAADFERRAALTAFLVIGAGGPGSLLFGRLADRWGRTRTTILSMSISGSCALLVGFFFGATPWLVTLIALLWGFTIVADSAQFSTAVSELSQREYMGTALTIHTSLGFLLTMVSIRLIPLLVDWVGWQWAFTVLIIGPLFGSYAMWQLQKSPAAAKLAGGRG